VNWLQVVVTSSVVASVISFLGNLLVKYFENRLFRRRERRQQLWKQKQEDIRDLEHNAGYLTELLGGYRLNDADALGPREALKRTYHLKCRLRKYPKVLQSARDFINRAGGILELKNDYLSQEQRDEDKDELEEKYKELIQACKDELKSDDF